MKLSPKDPTLSHPHCSEYGILEISEGVIIPKDPQIKLDISQRECYIEPNTTYELFIETSKGRIVNSTTIFIPECIYINGCKCLNEEDIPVPKISKITILNNTLEVDWLIHLNEIYSEDDLDTLELFIKNVSNPTLPWGGYKSDIGDIDVPLKLIAKENHHVTGRSLIPVEHTLVQGSTYEVHSRIIDDDGCVGNSVIRSFRMESQSSAFLYVKIATPVVSILLISLVLYLKFTRKDDSSKDDM